MIGMSFPSLKIKGKFACNKAGFIRELRYDTFKDKRADARENREMFFENNSRKLASLEKGSHQLQIIVNREEGTLSFALDGTKSKKSLVRPQL